MDGAFSRPERTAVFPLRFKRVVLVKFVHFILSRQQSI